MLANLNLAQVQGDFSLKDHIYKSLRAAIMELDIYSEDASLRLDERVIAEQLGVSRTPVREALVRLEQEQFVRIEARRGVFICRKSLSEVLDMIVAWAALESMAARLAAERASPSEIATLKRLVGKYDPEGASARLGEYSDANIQFHQGILQLSNCPLLGEMANNLFVHMRAVRNRAMAESDRARRSVADHAHIIAALESGSPAQAAEQVRKHTMRLHDHVRELWPQLTPSTETPQAT